MWFECTQRKTSTTISRDVETSLDREEDGKGEAGKLINPGMIKDMRNVWIKLERTDRLIFEWFDVTFD